MQCDPNGCGKSSLSNHVLSLSLSLCLCLTHTHTHTHTHTNKHTNKHTHTHTHIHIGIFQLQQWMIAQDAADRKELVVLLQSASHTTPYPCQCVSLKPTPASPLWGVRRFLTRSQMWRWQSVGSCQVPPGVSWVFVSACFSFFHTCHHLYRVCVSLHLLNFTFVKLQLVYNTYNIITKQHKRVHGNNSVDIWASIDINSVDISSDCLEHLRVSRWCR